MSNGPSFLVHPLTRAAFQRQKVRTGQTIGIGFVALAPTSAGVLTLLAPSPAAEGAAFAVEDVDGAAATNAITVDGNGATIDGAATVTLDTDGARAVFLFDGSEWRRAVPQRQRAFVGCREYSRAAELPPVPVAAGIPGISSNPTLREITLEYATVINAGLAGTVPGLDTVTKEAAALTVDATPTAIATLPLVVDAAALVDAVVLAVEEGAPSAMLFKRQCLFLRVGGVVDASAVTDVATEFVNGGGGGVSPGWDVTIDDAGGAARVVATGPAGASVRWYVLSMQQTAASP